MGQNFFGLKFPDDKIRIHGEIFDLAYYSGCISLIEAYELPVHLRYFYTKCLVKAKEEERAAHEKSTNSTSEAPNHNKIDRPF